MAYMVVGPDGVEHGPVELSVLLDWARAGQLPATAPVRDLETGSTVAAGAIPGLVEVFGAFSQPPGPAGASSAGSVMMPTRNPAALWGYYLGWLSLLCVIGLPFAPFALVKSLRGLRAWREDPAVFGKAHAVVGIVLASIGLAGNLFLLGLVVVNL